MSLRRLLVAAIQMNSGSDEAENWGRVEDLARRARDRGARLVAFPENVLYEGEDKGRRHALDAWRPRFAALAAELSVTLLAGTLREPTPAASHAWNTSLLFGPDGALLASYRKIHLFDVDVPGGPNELESGYVRPGEPTPVTAEVQGLGTVGLSVCYDLRFPELYRALAARGARALFIPSSFALGTGKDHWLTLVRARAIENQAFVIAPDQFGRKPHGRTKYGKTCIVDPWGAVLAQARETDEDVVVAELDLDHQDAVRRALPCLEHRRL